MPGSGVGEMGERLFQGWKGSRLWCGPSLAQGRRRDCMDRSLRQDGGGAGVVGVVAGADMVEV